MRSPFYAYSHDAGFGYNSDSFQESVFGTSALASYASGMASSFVSGGLDTQLRGFVGNTYAGGVRLDALAGSLAGQGLEYAMTGEATFNLLNMRDLTGGSLQGGVLEMHLGDSGFSMNMGADGADMSIGTVAGAMSGFKAWGTNAQLALSSQEEARKYTLGMRTISSTENASDSALYADILAGRANVVEDTSQSYNAKTTLANGIRTITLGGDKSILTSDLSLGVLFSHEGYRNGIDDGTQGQLDETVRAIRGHVGTAAMIEATYGTGSLGGQMSEELAAIASGDNGRIAQAFGRYDSSEDYWRLIKKGTTYSVEWDNSLDLHLANGDGSIDKTLDAASISTSAGMKAVEAWFASNGLSKEWDATLSSSFAQLGNVSVNAKALMDSVKNNGVDFSNIAAKFQGSVADLLSSELQLDGMLSIPDQTKTYSFMPGDIARTTLYGWRLKTPEIDKISGVLYSFSEYIHNAEDYAKMGGGSTPVVAPLDSALSLSWNNQTGLGIRTDFGNGYSLGSNHLDAISVMNTLQAMITSKSSTSILAGLQFGTTGNTGSASAGNHNHLQAYHDGAIMLPSELFKALSIPQVYRDYDTGLTGYSSKLAFNDPKLLSDIRAYALMHKSFDKKAYVAAHPDSFKPYSVLRPNGFNYKYQFDLESMMYLTSGRRP